MSPLIALWFYSLARASWEGGLALGFVWAAVRLAKGLSHRVRSWLWRIAYFKMVLALFSLPALPLPMSVLPWPLNSAVGTAQDYPGYTALPLLFTDIPLDFPHSGMIHSSATLLSRLEDRLSAVGERATTALFLLWAAGGLFFGTRLIRERREAGRFRSRCTPIQDPELLRALAELAGRLHLRRAPGLLLSPGSGSPLLLGARHPVIVLPSDLIDRCSAAEARLMIAHELAHCQRGDLLWSWLPALAHAVFFFHPFIALAGREWRLAAELACDEIALAATDASPRAYGSVLLKVAAQCRPSFRPGLAAIDADDLPRTLKRRLIAMKSIRSLSRRDLVVATLVVGVLGTALLVPWRAAADPNGDSKSDPVAQKTGAPIVLPTLADVDQMLAGKAAILQSLSLTGDQMTQLQALSTQAHNQAQQILGDSTLTDEQKARSLKQALGSALAGIQSILNPAQWNAFEGPKGGQKQEGGDPVEKIASTLLNGENGKQPNLAGLGWSPEGQSHLNALIQDGRNRIQALKNDTTMSGQAKKVQFAAVVQGFETQLRSLATPAQLKQLMSLSGSASFHAVTAEEIDRVFTKISAGLQPLNLTDDQKSRVQAILTGAHNRSQALFADKTLSDPDRNGRSKMLIESVLSSIQSQLTPDQQQQFNGPLKGGEGTFLVELKFLGGLDLGLTSAQQAQVKQLGESWEQQFAALNANSPTKGADAQALEEWGKQQLRSILTPDQQAAFSQAIHNAEMKKSVEPNADPGAGLK